MKVVRVPVMDDLVNQLPCGVFLLNEDGLIRQINATAERHLGYAPGELTGQPISRVLTIASRLFYQTHLYPLINLHGRADEVAMTLLTRNGERLPVLLNALRQHHDGYWLISCAYLPVAQRHHFEAELIQARKAAEQARLAVEESEAKYRALATELEVRVDERTAELSTANQNLHYLNADLKRSNENLQQFAYVASHDLQEPLRKVQQFGNLLHRKYADQLGEEGADFIKRMQTSAGRMTRLIEDLLVYSRISTRQETTEPTDLGEVVKAVLTDLELRIQETGAVVEVAALPTVPGSALQLSQLFQNLLSNALKFRRPDVSPVIGVTAEVVAASDVPPKVIPARPAAMYQRINVSDNGIGFEEQYLDRIFQVFQRLHGRAEYAGTGIGLAICEKVATNHGGAITATSQPGQGTTFSVYLPV